MHNERSLVVSVKPRYAELLLSGVKTVELRRVRPRVAVASEVLIYASSPQKALVGTARVAAVDVDSLEAIWDRHAPATGLDRVAYDAYFEGVEIAVAIALSQVRCLRSGLALPEMRRRVRGFQPPQSFGYLSRAEAAALT